MPRSTRYRGVEKLKQDVVPRVSGTGHLGVPGAPRREEAVYDTDNDRWQDAGV